MSHDFSKAPPLGSSKIDIHYYQCTKCGLIGYLVDTDHDTDHFVISLRSQLPPRWAKEDVDSITCDEYQIAMVLT